MQIYAYNALKYVWRPGSARTRWGSYCAPQALLAAIREPNSQGKEREGLGNGRGKLGGGREERLREGMEGEEVMEKGKGGEGKICLLLILG